MSESVILLENPRKRRRKSGKRRSRTASGRFKKKGTRRRRRNPARVSKPRRRRRRAVAAAPRRRRRSTRRPAVRRRRRTNPARIGRVLNMRRAVGIIKDGACLAAAEFLGDVGSRLLWQRVDFISSTLRGVGMDDATGPRWLQLVLAIVGGPIVRRARIIPRGIVKQWETANAASALIGLTDAWRFQALSAMQLQGYGGVGGGGISDWVTSAPAPARIAAPAAGDGLSDWATVDGSASYTGDPFSM